MRKLAVVVAAGTEDVFVPLSLSEAMAARLPHADLVRFVGAGHRVLAERPEEVARALSDLLGQVRSQGPAQRVPTSVAS